MLKTIQGYKDTKEAAGVLAAIETRHNGGAQFVTAAPALRQQPQAPKL